MAFDEPPRPDERLDDWARAVVDAALEVHKVLGPGFAESVHEEALAVELSRRDIPFERQVPLTVKYKGFCVGEGRVDLLVGGELIVELNSVEQLAGVHVAQVISYLKAFERPPEVAHHLQRQASQEWRSARRPLPPIENSLAPLGALGGC
ncbi:MAG: GxxExxY protein [Polyangiaceae bacterium]|nr:GxxExxY protein [Polyangiaceae bacterium]